MDATNLINDKFSTSKALLKWIGLSYKLTDEEVLPILDAAIREEMKLGLKNLHPDLLAEFQHDLTTFLLQPLQTKQSWLCNICKAREKSDSTNLIEDQFSQPGMFCTWLV